MYFEELEGIVLINNVMSIDLEGRSAVVIGKIDPESEFFEEIMDNVMALWHILKMKRETMIRRKPSVDKRHSEWPHSECLFYLMI